uniref:Peptidase_M13_N domain-containing protein n=1 Tax=Macrostomum lignano TaxID=282301 RepID=A0A1I8GVP0_9PLAT
LKEHQDRSLGDISVPQERNGLRHFIIQLVNDLEHLGDSVGQNYADSVLTVLQSLAQISLPGSHPLKDHPLLRAQRMSIAEFKQRLKASGKPLIHFDKLIAQFIHGDPEVNIDSMVIAVDNPNYFYRLENLLKTLRDDDLKKYLEFCIIRHFAPYYSAKSRRDCLRHSAQLNGQEHAEEQWLTCLRLLRSPGLNAVYFGEMKAKLRLGMWNLTSNQTLLQMVTGWTKFLQFRARARLKSNRSTFESVPYLKFGIIGSAIAAQMTKAFDAIGSLWTGLEDLAVNEQPLLLSSEAENCYASLQATVDV